MNPDGRRGLPRLASAPNMALQQTRRPRIRSGRSLRSLGSPLNARPLDGEGTQPFSRRL